MGATSLAGAFLGMDNIGVFDRDQPLPDGGTLEQSDGTSWMAKAQFEYVRHRHRTRPARSDL